MQVKQYFYLTQNSDYQLFKTDFNMPTWVPLEYMIEFQDLQMLWKFITENRQMEGTMIIE